MLKKVLLLVSICAIALPSFAAGIRHENSPFYINEGISEINLLGGIAVSDSARSVQGKDVDFGGSGYGFGLTGLTYLNPYVGAGLDFIYANNGNGASFKNASGEYTEIATKHYTPLFYIKINLMPASPIRLYVPLGIGMDFATVSANTALSSVEGGTQTGLALMAGLGLEVELSQGTFAGVEGRYNYADFFGKDANGISSASSFNILFKVGMRFDSSFLM